MADKAELQVSVGSLHPADFEGWFTKCGGSFSTFTWKRRWGVLKGNRLWYFAGISDTTAKGFVEIGPGTVCQEENDKKKKNMFSIQGRGIKHANRVFMMYTDSSMEMNQWISAIKKNCSKDFGASSPSVAVATPTATPMTNVSMMTPQQPAMGTGMGMGMGMGMQNNATPQAGMGMGMMGQPSGIPPQQQPMVTPNVGGAAAASPVRAKVTEVRNNIPFVSSGDAKLLEFWQIWFESIPAKADIEDDQSIEWSISISSDCEKLSWRTAGPQNIFIQKMVDFFWNVGAPEGEIDRLNDVGASINPTKIGSWIDMSAKGGMDGGWFFPVDILVNLAVEAGDPGNPSKVLSEWCATSGVSQCFSVGRDMGAAPPRQTEARLMLPGLNFAQQLEVAKSAFATFNFPNLPDNFINLLNMSGSPGGLMLSIVTSSEGFVRIGLLVPNPNRDLQASVVNETQGRLDILSRLEGVLGKTPSAIEFQFLNRGFGYGVYKEGFDVMFHYMIGEERKF